MTRSALCLVLLAACGSSHKQPREVAKFAVPGDGGCHEAGGCEAPISDAPRYELPDSEHGAPGDPSYGPSSIGQASCSDVARTMAALDLGNYAPDEQLGPAMGKHKAACVKLKLSKDERQCVFEATDKASVSWCAPRYLPGAVAIVEPKACSSVIDQLRQHAAPYAQSQPIVAKQIDAVKTSCEQDRWTIAFGECVRSVPYPGYVPAYCGGAGPIAMRRKLEERLAQVR